MFGLVVEILNLQLYFPTVSEKVVCLSVFVESFIVQPQEEKKWQPAEMTPPENPKMLPSPNLRSYIWPFMVFHLFVWS